MPRCHCHHRHLNIRRGERPGTLERHVVLDADAYQIPFVRPVPLAVQQLRSLVFELLVLQDDLPFVSPVPLSLVDLSSGITGRTAMLNSQSLEFDSHLV